MPSDPICTILIVDDHEPSRKAMRHAINTWGYSALTAATYAEALEEAEHHEFDLALIDYMLPDGNGIDLLGQLLVRKPGVPVIIITGYGDIALAVKAVKAGAYDFLTKPVKLEVLESLVRHALEEMPVAGMRQAFAGKGSTELGYDFETMVGRSRPMQRLYSLIRKVAPTEVTVMLEGESGTGKELAADAIHDLSPRHNGPLIKLHCAALSEGVLESELFGHEKGAFTGAVRSRIGRFEAAHGGTLFLDEISEMPLATQVKLLRIMQEQRFERVGSTETIGVDVRIIGATNANLQQRVREGKFRDDLYFRFKVITLKMPPLRERDGDILLLAGYFLKYFSDRYNKHGISFAPPCAGILLNYPWPGNVRELRNLVEAVVVLTDEKVVPPEELIAHLDPTLYRETAALHKTIPEDARVLDKPAAVDLEELFLREEGETMPAVTDASEGTGDMESMERELIKTGANRIGGQPHQSRQIAGHRTTNSAKEDKTL